MAVALEDLRLRFQQWQDHRSVVPFIHLLQDEIRRNGPMTFYDFMQQSLYHPRYGFYTSRVELENTQQRDFLTHPIQYSPEFGQGVATIIDKLNVQNREAGGINRIVSLAAGSGRLDQDILDYMKSTNPSMYNDPDFKYSIVDVSPHQIAKQRELLHEHLDKLEFIPQSAIDYLRDQSGQLERTFVFSNELLDAFPVHKVRIVNGVIQQSFITLDDRGEFIEVYGDLREQDRQIVQKYLEHLRMAGSIYEDGIDIIINPGMLEMGEALSEALVSGFSLMIDYGTSLIAPMADVRTYSRNWVTKKQGMLRNPGLLDMTTNIDWGVWRQITHKLQQVSMTTDLMLLMYFGDIRNQSMLRDSLMSIQQPYLASLQSAGGYHTNVNSVGILYEAEKQSFAFEEAYRQSLLHNGELFISKEVVEELLHGLNIVFTNSELSVFMAQLHVRASELLWLQERYSRRNRK